MSSNTQLYFDLSSQYDPHSYTQDWDSICLVTQKVLSKTPKRTSQKGAMYLSEVWEESSFLCREYSSDSNGLVKFIEPLMVSPQRKLFSEGMLYVTLTVSAAVQFQIQCYGNKNLFFEKLHGGTL